MTDKTITMSRELAENIAAYLEGSASGTVQFWHEQLRALLAKSDLVDHCKQCAEVVNTWPESKRDCLGKIAAPVVEPSNKCGRCGASTIEGCNYLGCHFLESGNGAPVVERHEPIGIEGMPQYLILFDDTERPIETMFGEEIARKRYADISMSWNAHLFVKIDSNSRDAMFAKNNATVVTSPPAPVAVARYKTYITQPAESLAGMAARQLKDEKRWIEIRDANSLEFPDMCASDYYPVGSAILIPVTACLDKVKELNQ